MSIESIEANSPESRQVVTQLTSAQSEAYSGKFSDYFKVGICGQDSGTIDFGAHDIYKGAADSGKTSEPDKSQEASDGARTTPLAAQQRQERLTQNKDVDQAGSPAEKEPENFKRPSEAPDKSQEAHDGARPTALAARQRQERLDRNRDLDMSMTGVEK